MGTVNAVCTDIVIIIVCQEFTVDSPIPVAVSALLHANDGHTCHFAIVAFVALLTFVALIAFVTFFTLVAFIAFITFFTLVTLVTFFALGAVLTVGDGHLFSAVEGQRIAVLRLGDIGHVVVLLDIVDNGLDVLDVLIDRLHLFFDVRHTILYVANAFLEITDVVIILLASDEHNTHHDSHYQAVHEIKVLCFHIFIYFIIFVFII